MVFLFFAALILPLLKIKGKTVSPVVSYGLTGLGSIVGIALAWNAIHSPPVSWTILTLRSLPDVFTVNIRADGVSGFFMMLLFILSLAASVYAPSYMGHYGNRRSASVSNGLFSGFILTMLFVFTAGNMFTFLLAWELMAIRPICLNL